MYARACDGVCVGGGARVRAGCGGGGARVRAGCAGARGVRGRSHIVYPDDGVVGHVRRRESVEHGLNTFLGEHVPVLPETKAARCSEKRHLGIVHLLIRIDVIGDNSRVCSKGAEGGRDGDCGS